MGVSSILCAFLLSLCNPYYSMGKVTEGPVEKDQGIEGMTQNRPQNPGLSALYKHPKISLLFHSAFLAGGFKKTLSKLETSDSLV